MSAVIYQCANREHAVTSRCGAFNIGTRATCPGCGSAVRAITGHAVLIAHRGDSRYRLGDAVREFATYSAAERAAARAYGADNRSNLVARFLL